LFAANTRLKAGEKKIRREDTRGESHEEEKARCAGKNPRTGKDPESLVAYAIIFYIILLIILRVDLRSLPRPHPSSHPRPHPRPHRGLIQN
jgi:hypothetical protein